MIINIIFFIFIFLYILWRILERFQPKLSLNEKSFGIQFLLELDNFYILNKFVTFFMISLYLFLNSVVFLIFRIQLLGTSYSIDFSIIGINYINIINFMLFILNINLYLKILNLIFYSHIIKLHFYLYQKNWYIMLNDFQKDNNFIISNTIRKIKKMLFSNEIPHSTIFSQIFFKLSLYSSRFISYIPLCLVMISLIIDLYRGCFFYIYYVMLFYFLTNMIKKMRRFLYVKDNVYDARICRYFYQNTYEYLKIKQWLIENSKETYLDYSMFGDETNVVLYSKDELVNYFKYDFHVYYTLDPYRIKADKCLNARVKRIHILILLFSGIIYHFYNIDKYHVILFEGFEINLVIWLMIIFIFCCICDWKVLININGYDENKKYKNIFMFLVILLTIIILYLMLKNKLTNFPNELLLDLKYLKILEDYSMQEKVVYLEKYLDNVIYHKYQNNIEYWSKLRVEIIKNISITSEQSLQDLRNIVLSYINENLENTDKGFLQKVIDKIRLWIT